MMARGAGESGPVAVPMRVLVTGAGGFVGRHLVPALKAAGHAVLVLSRAGESGNGSVPAPKELRDIETGPAWPSGIDAIVHLAAANPGRLSRVDETALNLVNVEGTAALARRAAREGIRRFVHLSTANVHAPSSQPIAEDAPIAPASAYARSKAAGEAALAVALSGAGVERVVLRPAPVFGRGGRGSIALLAKMARLPVPLPIGGIFGRRSLIAVESLCDAIRTALVSPKAEGTFLLADGALTPAEMVAALREGFGRRPGTFTLPFGRPLTGSSPKDFVLDASAAEAALGWRASGTLAPGLAAYARSL